ncbi:MAG: YceI family protein [Bacteroidales bacterium]|nr:YceI family protein [Bacteroidales bacterium]
MKSIKFIVLSTLLLSAVASNGQTAKFVSSKTHIKFYSHTTVEDIQANNYASVSTIDPLTGDVAFSVPMQGFEFEKALMQKHYNSEKFLDTKQFPKAKLKGKITNLSEIDLSKDGTYNAIVEGELTIKGVTKPIKEKGTITVKGNVVKAASTFNVTLADYGIAFEKGKPSTNIAKTVEVTVLVEYQPE